ncbi:MAG: hypothetical protein WBF17_22225, partial [Phycisphaerae bacterium]
MRTQRSVAIALTLVSFVCAASAAELEKAMDLAGKTLAFVERSAPRPKLAAELKALEGRLGMTKAVRQLKGVSEDQLYDEVLRLRRRIILSHPLLGFDKLLINKRTCRIPGHMCDQYLGRHHSPGPGLAILESWKDHPKETLLLEGKLPQGLTLHPDLSFDAGRVVFSFCDTSNPKRREERGHFIYEIDLDTGKVRQITGTARDRFKGAGGRQTVLIEDFDPCYLPDGGIAFISTRSQQYGRCHGSRYVPSYVLYRADADGLNIRRLSFNEANEWDPAVLHDGTLIYCRWDYINRHDTNFQSLWVIRPDGRSTAHFYGNNSVGPCMITEAKPIPGSHKVVATATDHHGNTSGSIIVIDTYKGQDGGEPLLGLTPEIGFPERGAPRGTTFVARPLREVAAASGGSRGRRSRSGRAATPFPVSEDLFFVAMDQGGRYAIYLIDTLGGRELIYEDPKISCFAPIPVRPVPRPPAVCSMPAGTDEKTGLFFVQDVYQSTERIERGTIKALRVSQIISQPTRSKPRLSYVNNEIIKRILGTVPVDEDGSVAFEAPARTPLQLQILDENGMAVMTMRSLVYLQPGEMAGCVGCHEPREDTPVSFEHQLTGKIQRLRTPAGPRYEGGFSFARTVQPVLDRHCIKCHGLKKTEGGMNLLGTPSGTYSTSYDSIMKRGGLVKIAQRNSESVPSRPKDYFAHAGKLVQVLREKHKDRVRLDRESFQRIVDWLDLNAQYYGDYSFNRAERQPPDRAGEEALRERIRLRFGEELAGEPFAGLVNVALPSESRILKAPLAAKAGGWGQITTNGWSSTKDRSYQEMLKLVEGSIRPVERHDIAGTCGAEDGGRGCRCGCCWVRQVRAERQ